MAGSNTNVLIAETDTPSESTYSVGSSEKKERSRRIENTHGNKKPKHYRKISGDEYSPKGLRTPRFLSGPDIFNLQQNEALAESVMCGEGKVDRPRPPASIDGHKKGLYK